MERTDGTAEGKHHGILLAVDDAMDYVAGEAEPAAKNTGQEVAWNTEPDSRFVPGVCQFVWRAAQPEVIPEQFARLLVRLEDLIETGNWKHRRAWTAPDRAIFTVKGNCPVCHHPMSDREGALTDAEKTTHANILIACNCLGKHDERPAEILRGCGQAAVFKHPAQNGERVDVPADESALPEGERSLADPDDLVWEQQRQSARMEALKRTQATAEKWAATVGVLTGLFSLAAIITSADAIAKVRNESWFWLVPLCSGLAFLTAALSIYLAAVAAQGIPHAPNIDGQRYRLISVADALKAGVQLKWSRRTAIAAVVALGLGVGVMLYAKPSAETTTTYASVQLDDGSVVCVDLQTLAGGGLNTGGAPLTGVHSVAISSDCKAIAAPQSPST